MKNLISDVNIKIMSVKSDRTDEGWLMFSHKVSKDIDFFQLIIFKNN